MNTGEILDLIVIVLGIICLAVAIPTWVKVQKEWRKEKDKQDGVHTLKK